MQFSEFKPEKLLSSFFHFSFFSKKSKVHISGIFESFLISASLVVVVAAVVVVAVVVVVVVVAVVVVVVVIVVLLNLSLVFRSKSSEVTLMKM